MATSLYDLMPRDEPCDNDALLGRFLQYVESRHLDLYPAQESAILELFEGHNVILNTPTGSGKSLVATAVHFQALAQGRRSIYTCPIKALVNEKFLALCRDFGPQNVGLSTGDGTVNRDAPILCCTAEILANMRLENRGAVVADPRNSLANDFAERSNAGVEHSNVKQPRLKFMKHASAVSRRLRARGMLQFSSAPL